MPISFTMLAPKLYVDEVKNANHVDVVQFMKYKCELCPLSVATTVNDSEMCE